MSDKTSKLSEELKKKLAACKTAEEAKKLLTEAGIEPLDDDLLAEVSGGRMGSGSTSSSGSHFKPREIP